MLSSRALHCWLLSSFCQDTCIRGNLHRGWSQSHWDGCWALGHGRQSFGRRQSSILKHRQKGKKSVYIVLHNWCAKTWSSYQIVFCWYLMTKTLHERVEMSRLFYLFYDEWSESETQNVASWLLTDHQTLKTNLCTWRTKNSCSVMLCYHCFSPCKSQKRALARQINSSHFYRASSSGKKW